MNAPVEIGTSSKCCKAGLCVIIMLLVKASALRMLRVQSIISPRGEYSRFYFGGGRNNE